ncbi:MAG: ABC transporter substrate-binding protein [Chloroflexi bacterium]|nr:ABC transporter substrate-binding protein [Chloroflexota bacterium]
MRAVKLMASCLAVIGLVFSACAPGAAPLAPPTPKVDSPSPVPKATETIVQRAPAPLATPKPSADQPKYGGVLNRSIRAEIPHFDMHSGSSSTHIHPIVSAYNGLVQFDPAHPGEIIGDLAESWAGSGDGLTYTFNLRKGVKWHDGTPFSSADVPPSMERIKKNVHAGPGTEPVKATETADENTVKLVLSYASAGMMSYLATVWGAIVPKHVLQKKGNMRDDILGTGAFKFKQFDRGIAIELEKNPNFFISGMPYIDRIRTYFIQDEASAIAALRTGRVDYMIWIGDAGAMRVKETYKEGTVGQLKGNQYRAIFLPTNKSPWTDARVRKAVNLAIDREAAIKVIAEGIGDLGSHLPEAVGGIAQADLKKMPGYRQPKDADIAEAKRLLAEAGFPTGFKTSTLHRKGLEYESQAVFMRDQLGRIGIDVSLRTMDDAAYYDIREKRGYETFSARHSMSVNDPDLILKKWYKTGSTENWASFSDAELDKLIDLQSREQDPKKRAAMVRQANERLEELVPAVMLFWSGYWRAWGPRIRNFVLPAQHYDGEKFVDVWLDR